MFYFFKKRSSRFLTLLLVFSMVGSLLAGCGSAKPEETEPSEQLPSGLVEVKPTEATTVPTETTAPVNENLAIVKDQLNVRSSPSTGAKIIGYLDPGTEVEIIKTETYMGVEWALIREGWIVLDYVEMANGGSEDPTEETTPEETKPAEGQTGKNETTVTKGTITANGLNIRKEANGTSTILGSYPKGATVTILETKNGWGRTDKGWISMDYVKTTGTTTTETPTATPNNTTADGKTYFITASELNIRSTASTTGDKVGTYYEGDKITVIETSNGWGKTDKGWISMQYAYKLGDTGADTGKGVVIGDTLNIRSGPGTGYDSVGSLKYGDRVTILERITVGNGTWAAVSNGWISLGYVYVDGTTGDGSGTGTVTGDALNIRSGPGTGYGSVGSLNKGDTVKILAQIKIGDTYWGCIDKGWVSMDFVGVG